MDKAADAYISMLEMTRIVGSNIIPHDKLHSQLTSTIESNKKNRIKISDSHYAIQLNNGNTILYHHSKEHNYHSISMLEPFGTSKDHYVHAIASKGTYSDASKIYQNIQTLVDKGKTVFSDDTQTKGGRNLWRNIHKFVNFKTASLHNEDGTHIKDIENFADLSKDESDPYRYAIRN